MLPLPLAARTCSNVTFRRVFRESDTYELSATDLEMLGGISADQPVQDPLADTRRDTEQSQPGVATEGETVSGPSPKQPERKSTEEQRMDSDWEPDDEV